AVVVIVRVAEQLDLAAGGERQVLIDDERCGRAPRARHRANLRRFLLPHLVVAVGVVRRDNEGGKKESPKVRTMAGEPSAIPSSPPCCRRRSRTPRRRRTSGRRAPRRAAHTERSA